jgi:hypothetical protein
LEDFEATVKVSLFDQRFTVGALHGKGFEGFVGNV